MIATEGWTQTTSLPAVEAIKRLTGRGVRSFVYTDVSRDGMLSGVDLDDDQADRGRRPRPLHLLGRDRHARRPARARAAASGQSRGRDRGQVAVREEVHGRGGSSRARRRVSSNDAEGAVLRGHGGRALSCHGLGRRLRRRHDRRDGETTPARDIARDLGPLRRPRGRGHGQRSSSPRRPTQATRRGVMASPARPRAAAAARARCSGPADRRPGRRLSWPTTRATASR